MSVEEQLDMGFEPVRHARFRRCGGNRVAYIKARFPDLEPPATSESDSVYMDVMYQRSHGSTCYRVGQKTHLLNGEIVSSQQLRARSGGAWTSST